MINDKLSLTSITTHRTYDEDTANDFDFSNDDTQKFHMTKDSTFKTLSQEVRANYENKDFKVVSGIFLAKEDFDMGKGVDAYWMTNVKTTLEDVNSDSMGLFSHITYNVNEKLSVLGGLRYDKIEQTYKSSSETIDNDESEISPKIGLTYDLKENMMSYVTISKGYKEGGFNTFAPAGYSKTFDKETLYSYEVGLKGSTMNGRLIYDTAIYYMNIKDMQVDVYYDAWSFTKTNAAKATSMGIETSLNFQATDTVNLFGGFSYNDATFDEYHNGLKDYSGNRTITILNQTTAKST